MTLGKDFLPRLGSALVLAPIALFAAYAGGWLFTGFLALAAVLVLWEWVVMTDARPKRPVLVLSGLSLAAAAGLTQAQGALAGLGALALGAAALALVAERRVWALAGLAYAAAAVVPAVALRQDPAAGGVALFWLFAVVWGTDIAAFFCGRLIGGPKLWPRVSPNKTWSGAIGGTVVGTAAGLLAVAAFGVPATPALLAVGVLASIASQGGDLYESAMKRHFGCKDSSALIPGHGGLMDRLDGFVAAALVALLVGLLRHPQAPASGLLGL